MVGNQDHDFDDSLRDQDAVERVFVYGRQLTGHLSMSN
jgi:hypothetical protein